MTDLPRGSRSAGWLLPLGCLGAAAGVTLVAFGLVAVPLLLVFAALAVPLAGWRAGRVRRQAAAMVKDHPQVKAALGEPVEVGRPSAIRMQTDRGRRRVDLVLPVRGPRNHGTVHATAIKGESGWAFQVLDVEVAGEPGKIKLAGGPQRPPSTRLRDQRGVIDVGTDAKEGERGEP